MKKRHLLAAGLGSLLFFSVALAPATLLRLIVPDDQGIQLGRLSGSLWNGQAASLSVKQHQFTDIDWELLPSRIFTGKVTLALDLRYQQQPVSTIAAVGLDQALYLQDTSARLPASMLAQHLSLPMGELDGTVMLELQRLRLAQQQVPLAQGTVDWKQASITVAETADLGNVSIVLDGYDNDELFATLSNQGGDLVMSGDGKVIDNGDYTLALKLAAGNGASNNVKNSLRMFAKPQPDGSYRVENSGNIFELPL